MGNPKISNSKKALPLSDVGRKGKGRGTRAQGQSHLVEATVIADLSQGSWNHGGNSATSGGAT